METLFSLDPVMPDGFIYQREFISREEEAALLEHIRSIDLHPMKFHGYEGKRKVASFGYDWSFEKRTLSKGREIPAAFDALIEKTARHLSLQPSDFGELLLTEYPAGAVINWHRDAPPFETIVGISLLSDCTFRLRPYDKQKQGRKSIRSLTVHRRSLYVIQGEARTDWEHSTAPVDTKRYSITLRTLR